jgi:hypothetical protein
MFYLKFSRIVSRISKGLTMPLTEIQMPYLHWDSQKCFITRADFLKRIHERMNVEIPVSFDGQRSALYKIFLEYLNKGSSYHPRRSLDQFFYSRLPDTSLRDKDQVVSKHTGWSPGGPKMMMVDQLWLWVIAPDTSDNGNREGSSKATLNVAPHTITEKPNLTSLVTFFPRKECDGDTQWETADLKQRILNELGDRPWEKEDACYVAAIAIQQAVNIMFQVRNESLDFLEIFREAIGEAVRQPLQHG